MCIVSWNHSAALQTIQLTPHSITNLNPHLKVYQTEDTLSGQQALHEIVTGLMPVTDVKSNAGMKYPNSAYWARTILFNSSKESYTFYLEIDYPQLDLVQLFEVMGDSVNLLSTTGDQFPFDNRPILARNFVFPFTIASQDSVELLINMDKRKSSMRFPMTVYPEKNYINTHFTENLLNSIFFGLLTMVFLGSILIGFSSQKTVFLVYAAYIFALGLWLFSRLGYTYQFLLSDQPEINRHFLPAMAQLATMALIWYIQHFFQTKKYYPKINWIMTGFQVFFIFGYVFWLSFPRIMVEYAVQLFPVRYFITGSVLLLTIITAIFHIRVNRFNAIMFLLGYLLFFVAVASKIFMEYGLLSDFYLVVDPIVLGFVVEVIVLSIAMWRSLSSVLKQNLEFQETSKKQYHHLKSKAVLPVDKIMYIKSAGHYLEYFIEDKDYPEIDRNKLADVKESLPSNFVQIQRSYLVNVDFIKMKYATKVILKNTQELPVSRTYKEDLNWN